MKHDQQQKNGAEPDEEPTNPTSAAARLDSVVSIIAHESSNLGIPLSNRNRTPSRVLFLD